MRTVSKPFRKERKATPVAGPNGLVESPHSEEEPKLQRVSLHHEEYFAENYAAWEKFLAAEGIDARKAKPVFDRIVHWTVAAVVQRRAKPKGDDSDRRFLVNKAMDMGFDLTQIKYRNGRKMIKPALEDVWQQEFARRWAAVDQPKKRSTQRGKQPVAGRQARKPKTRSRVLRQTKPAHPKVRDRAR